jgi:hypothetical protein
MDTVYSDVAAIDDGSMCTQLYVGTKLTLTDVYGMKTEKQHVNVSILVFKQLTLGW